MNWVDLVLVVVILLGGYTGWRRGFVRAMLFLATLVASLAIALLAYRAVAETLVAFIPGSGAWAHAVAFLVLFLGFQLLLDHVAQSAIGGVPHRVHGHPANAALGVLPGLVNGAVNAMLVVVVVLALPGFDAVDREIRASALAQWLTQPADWMGARLAGSRNFRN